VLCAPDWSDQPTWSTALSAWASAVGPDEPVTLALCLPDGADAAELAEGILTALEEAGHSEDTLPDLALFASGDAPLASLVAAADAVLLDGKNDSPELTRRARALEKLPSSSLVATGGTP
jgi:hypothetical protein